MVVEATEEGHVVAQVVVMAAGAVDPQTAEGCLTAITKREEEEIHPIPLDEEVVVMVITHEEEVGEVRLHVLTLNCFLNRNIAINI